MSQCQTCGNKAGAFRNECARCEVSRLAREADRQAQEAYAQWVAARESYVAASLSTMVNALQRGRHPSLLRVVPVTTGAEIDGEVVSAESFEILNVALLEGWEVVAVVPRTSAFSLTNVTPPPGGWGKGTESWAGGLGGNITGAYFVLGMRVTNEFLDKEPGLVRESLEMQYAQEVPPPGT